MYRVTYLLDDYVLHKNFQTFDDAACFGIRHPANTILEIKHYDIEIVPGEDKPFSLLDQARQQVSSATFVSVAEQK
jgi:hypothetical protein